MKANDIKEAVRTAALNAACFLAVVGPVEEAHARCCSCVSIGANNFVLTVFRKQQVGFFFLFTCATSALTPFISGSPSSCRILCVQNEMFTWRGVPYQVQHNEELLFEGYLK